MKLSVAMCTYNGAKYLQQQLDSIASQTRPPDELVVCDDASTDATTPIIEKFAVVAPFAVKLNINERNIGSTRNFENAIGLCAGDVIALADQDDVWDPMKLACMERVFGSSPGTGMVFSDADVVDENSRSSGYRLWQMTFNTREQRLVTKGRALDVLLRRNVVCGATMTFRAKYKDLILPIRLNLKGNIIHDRWIALLIAAVAEVRFLHLPLIKYRLHKSQQLGVALPGYPEKERSRNLTRTAGLESLAEFYLANREVYCQIRQRLKEANGGYEKTTSLTSLESKINYLQKQAEHLQRRAQACQSNVGLDRAPFVVKELFALRYSRYSRGVISAARDLIR